MQKDNPWTQRLLTKNDILISLTILIGLMAICFLWGVDAGMDKQQAGTHLERTIGQ